MEEGEKFEINKEGNVVELNLIRVSLVSLNS